MIYVLTATLCYFALLVSIAIARLIVLEHALREAREGWGYWRDAWEECFNREEAATERRRNTAL